jgi:hypothetical protein
MDFRKFETKVSFGVFALIMGSSLALNAAAKENPPTPFGIQLPLADRSGPALPINQNQPVKKMTTNGSGSKKMAATKAKQMPISTQDAPSGGKKKAPALADMNDLAAAPFGIQMPMGAEETTQLPFIAAPSEKKQEPKTVRYPSRFQVGGNYAHVGLKPHGSANFEGDLGGILGLYDYRPMDNFYGGARVTWLEGNTHGSSGKRSLLYIDVQERFGYTFASRDQNMSLTLFSGLGFRHIGQHLHPKNGSSIKFRYNEFYIPVGFLTDFSANSWFTWGLNFTWMPQVFPSVQIDPLKGTNWSLTDQISNFYVEMPFDFALTKSKRFHLIISPFYEHWKDGHSTARASNGVSLSLPGNSYDFYGANINFAYCF